MNDNDLAAIVCGEGMNSPKVTIGTGGAFGGVTDSLLDLGIPVCCVTDGPSGIRIGGDLKSTSLPNGYVFASSFDDDLTEQIFELEGIELFAYNIDALLGPGMNIHRHPLCGRNFEYFSEDPLLSGKIAAAQSRGITKSGCTTTIKHFSCNNQEFKRSYCNAVVSERALREIYLKGYEIAVKEGNATAIMTSYNPINGYWSASNYDLTTTVLRDEWGYKGFVMTDWWARCNCKGEEGTKENLKAFEYALKYKQLNLTNTKGGRPRDIPVETKMQENILRRVLAYAQKKGKRSMDYVIFDNHTNSVKKKSKSLDNWMNNNKKKFMDPERTNYKSPGKRPREQSIHWHSLRHLFYQETKERYKSEGRMTDAQIERELSESMGHSRNDVNNTYSNEIKRIR